MAKSLAQSPDSSNTTWLGRWKAVKLENQPFPIVQEAISSVGDSAIHYYHLSRIDGIYLLLKDSVTGSFTFDITEFDSMFSQRNSLMYFGYRCLMTNTFTLNKDGAFYVFTAGKMEPNCHFRSSGEFTSPASMVEHIGEKAVQQLSFSGSYKISRVQFELVTHDVMHMHVPELLIVLERE